MKVGDFNAGFPSGIRLAVNLHNHAFNDFFPGVGNNRYFLHTSKDMKDLALAVYQPM